MLPIRFPNYSGQLQSPLYERNVSGLRCLDNIWESLSRGNLQAVTRDLTVIDKALDRELGLLTSMHLERNQAKDPKAKLTIIQELSQALDYTAARDKIAEPSFAAVGSLHKTTRLINALAGKSEPELAPRADRGFPMKQLDSGLMVPALGGISDLSLVSTTMHEAGAYLHSLLMLLDCMFGLTMLSQKIADTKDGKPVIDLFTTIVVKADGIIAAVIENTFYLSKSPIETLNYIREQVIDSNEYLTLKMIASQVDPILRSIKMLSQSNVMMVMNSFFRK